MAFTETYKDLITKPDKQVLLPVIFYIDAANTGHFADLPITAVKFSLGIFTRKARDNVHLTHKVPTFLAVTQTLSIYPKCAI